MVVLLVILWFLCGIVGLQLGILLDGPEAQPIPSYVVWFVLLGPFLVIGIVGVAVYDEIKRAKG